MYNHILTLAFLSLAGLDDPRPPRDVVGLLVGLTQEDGAAFTAEVRTEVRSRYRRARDWDRYVQRLPSQPFAPSSPNDTFPSLYRARRQACQEHARWLRETHELLRDCLICRADDRRQALQKLRGRIGERAYWSGQMPEVPKLPEVQPPDR
jgi:hypothetical protein